MRLTHERTYRAGAERIVERFVFWKTLPDYGEPHLDEKQEYGTPKQTRIFERCKIVQHWHPENGWYDTAWAADDIGVDGDEK